MNIQPIKINFNNKTYQITFKGIDSEKPAFEKDLKFSADELNSLKKN